MLIAFTIFVALTVGLSVLIINHVSKQQHEQKLADMDMLRRDIERAERSHAPRRHLRKRLVEGVRRELERAS